MAIAALIAFTVATTVSGSVLSYMGSERQKDNLRTQKMIAKRRTKLEQDQRRRRERGLIGQQLAAGAAGGLQVGTGSSLNLLKEAESASRRESRRIQYEGQIALTSIDNALDDVNNKQVSDLFNASVGLASSVIALSALKKAAPVAAKPAIATGPGTVGSGIGAVSGGGGAGTTSLSLLSGT